MLITKSSIYVFIKKKLFMKFIGIFQLLPGDIYHFSSNYEDFERLVYAIDDLFSVLASFGAI